MLICFLYMIMDFFCINIIVFMILVGIFTCTLYLSSLYLIHTCAVCHVSKLLRCGDRIGFGIVYPAVKNQPGDRACQVMVIYCTINGKVIHHRAMEQPAGGFYPVISVFKHGKYMIVKDRPYTKLGCFSFGGLSFTIMTDTCYGTCKSGGMDGDTRNKIKK